MCTEFQVYHMCQTQGARAREAAKINFRWKNFQDLVCVDLFTLADADKRVRHFLNVVDKASGYQIVAPVKSKRPDEVLRVFLTSWLIPFGIPYNILHDIGGEFDREFGAVCEVLSHTECHL